MEPAPQTIDNLRLSFHKINEDDLPLVEHKPSHLSSGKSNHNVETELVSELDTKSKEGCNDNPSNLESDYTEQEIMSEEHHLKIGNSIKDTVEFLVKNVVMMEEVSATLSSLIDIVVEKLTEFKVGPDDLCHLSMAANTAMIFKDPSTYYDEFDGYKMALTGANIKTSFIPFFVNENIVNGDIQEALRNPELFSGIIFLNTAIFEGVKANMMHDTEWVRMQLIEEWRHKPIFVGNEAVLCMVEEFFDVEIGESYLATINNLPRHIKDAHRMEWTCPYFYPHGSHATPRFIERMESLGLEIEHQVVYRRIPNPNMSEDWLKNVNVNRGLPQILVFFNPETMHHILKTLHLKEYDNFNDFRIIAMGHRTIREAQECDIEIYGIPDGSGLQFFERLLRKRVYLEKMFLERRAEKQTIWDRGW